MRALSRAEVERRRVLVNDRRRLQAKRDTEALAKVEAELQALERLRGADIVTREQA